METTTFSEKNYLFYLEINENNYKDICSFIPYFYKLKGYDWKQLQSSGCPNSSNANYPINDLSKDPAQIITFPTIQNTFYIPSEISGKDKVSLTCKSSGTALLNGVNLPNGVCSSQVSCFTDTIPYFQNKTCSGETECKTFFPPSTLTYTTPMTTTPQIIYDGKSVNNIETSQSPTYPSCRDTSGNPVDICASGNPTFTYNLYKPLNYSDKPNINSNNTYVPPSTPFNAAFYNVSPLNATVKRITLTGSVPSTTYAVYEISYEIDDFSLLQNNQILDFCYLQQYLQSTFSSWFQSYQNKNKLEIQQLIMDFCNENGVMSDSVCNSLNIPSLIESSPCTSPYSNCMDSWNNFCSQTENYNSSICKDYYKSNYFNNTLDNGISDMLKSTCNEIYESNPSILSSADYMGVCACFLPKEIYDKFPVEINSENVENWYYPCYKSSIKPNATPPSPTSEIVSCMNKKYQNSSSTYDITSQIYNECYNEENPTTTIEPVQVKTTEVQNPSVNTSSVPVTPSSVTTTPVSSSVPVSESPSPESPSPESANSPISEVPIDGDSTTKAEMENTVSTGMIIVIVVLVVLALISVPLIYHFRNLNKNKNKKKNNIISPNTNSSTQRSNRITQRNNSRITINNRNTNTNVPYRKF